MTQIMKRLAALFLALLLLLPGLCLAEEEKTEEEYEDGYAETEAEEADADEAVTEKDGWHFNAKGFLTGDNPGDEYLLEDEKNGLWQYASKDLSITLTRYEEKTKKKKKQIYCVADIRCSPESPLGVIMTEPYARFGSNLQPGKRQEEPEKLMKQHPSVLAVSDDMYGLRIMEISKKKTKYDYHGVVIRNGEVVATKTRNSQKKRNWPNMDTLAVYADGSMKSYDCDALTAEEYLEKGAVQVFAFGPWLLSEGEIHPNLAKINDYSEPRVAIGMIEPWHYILIVTAGRPTSKYQGYKLSWLAEKMKELGCTEALNLDGGDTVALAFNNKVILHGNMESKKLRNLGSMIAFGLKDGPAEE